MIIFFLALTLGFVFEISKEALKIISLIDINKIYLDTPARNRLLKY